MNLFSTQLTSRYLLMLVLTFFGSAVQANGAVHHDLMVQLQPDSKQLIVTDTITLPPQLAGKGSIAFLLHGDLEIRDIELPITRTDKLNGADFDVPVTRFEIDVPETQRRFTLSYRGVIHQKKMAPGQEYGGGMVESAGIIDAEGVFLAASSLWFPRFDHSMVTFTMTLALPRDWDGVSQGKRTQHDKKRTHTLVRWEEKNPQDDIYLVAARFKQYEQKDDRNLAMVMMRNPDDALAQRYLDATLLYLRSYEEMLGDYPYDKFALVENFWETGYGMPSFTLLGPRVMRFPFIIYSSYPHEILHNWWGNGVFVDYPTGNWAEGLTNYLADHLLKENHGKGQEYRRDSLQKYTDFVRGSRDFPLTEFVSRHDPSSEAVGYGKTMMLFHMLRQMLGDDAFLEVLRRFYRNNLFKVAGFDDLAREFAARDAKTVPLFEQWVKRTGAPLLTLAHAVALPVDGEYELRFVLKQRQPEDVFQLRVPVAVTLAGSEQAWQETVVMNEREQKFSLKVPARPLLIAADPEFDVFRRLHNEEIPPALSQGFGAERIVMVLPSEEDPAMLEAYQRLIEQWQASQSLQLTVVSDRELAALPADSTVWLLGWQNKWRAEITSALAPFAVNVDDAQLHLHGDVYKKGQHSILLSARHPQAGQHTLLWLAAGNIDAVPGLARKLPHYGKYSYLVFAGVAPDNIVKEQWPVYGSPLQQQVTQTDGKRVAATPARLKTRLPLIPVPALDIASGRH